MIKKHGKDLSSNDFTDGYKKKLDSIEKIYKFKGNVKTYTELSAISASSGDVYNVLDEGSNYAWNGTEWVELGFIIDMSEFAYQEEVDEIKSAVNENAEDSLRQATIPSVIGENMGWYLALSGTLPDSPTYDSYSFTLLVNQILHGETGILYVNIRKDEDNVYVSKFKWLSNTGLSSECFKLNVVDHTFSLYVKTTDNYQRYQLRVLQEHNIDGLTLDLKYNLFRFNDVDHTQTVEEPNGINPMGTTNYVSGSAQPTGETFYGVPIYKVYVEGNMPTNGNSNIILYNCKQILSHNIYVNLPGTESWFSLNNDGIGGLGHSAQYNEVRIYGSNSGYDNATFKGFITYIQS